ncbi:uncharacterized protein K02A2.6-like [Vanessa atalanta]|uniref:uncharacterized protein K02A2.6-like n=1 Tax=Vanessa atalanta TaxID=42275 RepID=UPI001FCE0137|nr:uncharacterized protein K02A2.6-like [Vanessa atalanta]
MTLAAYDFTVEFVRSAENCQADALSRLPLPRSSVGQGTKECEAATYLNFVQDSFPLSFKDIKTETAKDPILSKMYGYVLHGWPPAVDKEYNAYFRRKENICIDQGCLLWGYKIIIPRTLQNAILKEIHDGHPGIVKMKQIARNYVWWATINADIERAARDCGACLAVRPEPPPAPLHSWPWPVEPWSRLHVDYLGPFNNKYYLVIIDAHSKWIEAEKVSSTSAANLISILRKIFARFGLPKRIISDNGPPFTSAEVATYFQRNGIGHTLSAPYHPDSNGAAENAVRSVKRALKKASLENEDEDTALSRFLFSYRNTEHSTTGREPSVALLGRRLRGRLDLLRPDTDERVRDRQLASELRRDTPLRVVAPGDSVLIRDYSRRNRKWAEGVVLDRSSPVSYSVKTSDGQIHKRHVDQIMCDKNRKSRFSLTKIEACDRPRLSVEAEDGSEAREPRGKEELANRSSPEKSPSSSTDQTSPVAPPIVLRTCAPELAPVLTRLFRQSYAFGVVLKSWKTALVHPIPKKGNRSDPSNYRPIAITSLFSKVMESIINCQLLRYLEEYQLISDRQYGFRRGRSAGDLLVYLTHRWAEAVESKGEALAASLDIAKAFDRVWHKALLSKLPAYGLPGKLCNWITSFLADRSIKVVVDGTCSDLKFVNAVGTGAGAPSI